MNTESFDKIAATLRVLDERSAYDLLVDLSRSFLGAEHPAGAFEVLAMDALVEPGKITLNLCLAGEADGEVTQTILEVKREPQETPVKEPD